MTHVKKFLKDQNKIANTEINLKRGKKETNLINELLEYILGDKVVLAALHFRCVKDGKAEIRKEKKRRKKKRGRIGSVLQRPSTLQSEK